MPITAERLMVEVGADTSQADKELSGFSERAPRSFGWVGGVAAGITGALTAAGAAAGAVGLRTAAGLEQANIGFTTMLGSAEAAQGFLGDLAAFAGKTPFEFPELQTAASSLISVGIGADKVIPIMKSLGNATSGMGTGAEGVQRATVALQQMNAAGKITAEDLNQLRDAGIPVYDLLASATGKSVEAVAELANKGKLGREELDQLMAALESGKGLERFTGLMEAQSASLNGMWSTLKDTFSMGMADAIQPLVPLIKEGLGGATAFVTAQLPALKAGMADVVTGVQGFVAGLQMKGPIDGFTGSLNTAGLGLRALVEAFRSPDVTSDGFVGVMEQIGSGARGLYDSIQTFIQGGGVSDMAAQFDGVGGSVKALLPAAQAFISQMPSVTDVVSVGATALGFLADHADLLVKYMPVLVGAVVAFKVAQLASNIAVAASPAIRLLEVAAMRAQTSAITELAAAQRVSTGATKAETAAQSVSMGTRLRAVGAFIAQGATMVASMAVTAASVVAGWVVMGVQSLIQAARMAAAWLIALGPVGWVIAAVVGLVALVIANWDTVSRVTAQVWAAVVGWVTDAWRAIVEWVTQAVTEVRAVIDRVFAVIVAIVTAYVNAWRAVIMAVWAAIVAAVGFYVGLVHAAISGLSSIAGKVGAWFGSVRDAIADKLSSAVEFVRGIPGKIVDALSGAGRLLYDSGAKIIQGLADGIRSAVGKVTGAVGDVMQRARDLLPFSPAKEGPFSGKGWSGYSGLSIPRDLAWGIAQNTNLVKRAAQGMASAAAVNVPGPSMGGPALGMASPAPSPAALGASGGAGGPSTVVIVDADGELIGTMRVQAGKVATGKVTPLDEGRPTW